MKFWEGIANCGIHTENALLIEDKDLGILLLYCKHQYEWITVIQCFTKTLNLPLSCTEENWVMLQ